jgi:hypothetical protein
MLSANPMLILSCFPCLYSVGHVAYSARFASYPAPPVTILLVLFPILSILLVLHYVLLMSYAKPISFSACPGPACLIAYPAVYPAYLAD